MNKEDELCYRLATVNLSETQRGFLTDYIQQREREAFEAALAYRLGPDGEPAEPVFNNFEDWQANRGKK